MTKRTRLLAMNVLVTGGAGYIGSQTCKTLKQAGFNPITYDNLVYGHEWAIQWGPFERGDILDSERLSEVFQKYKPEAVMHFAAYTYVGESVSNPAKYYQNNVVGSLRLLEACVQHQVLKFVFSSTCATYGMPRRIPMDEGHPQNPINPYGQTKLMIEKMLKDFEIAHQLRSISLRYFNAAGADPELDVGEVHDPETHLIPLAIQSVLGKGPALTIYGTDYETKDGTCIRDYIHIADLAEAHVLSLKKLMDQGASKSFNLGNGTGFSVKEVISALEKVSGRKVPLTFGPRRPGDPAELIANSELARNELQWKPIYPQLEKIIETAWNWAKECKI